MTAMSLEPLGLQVTTVTSQVITVLVAPAEFLIHIRKHLPDSQPVGLGILVVILTSGSHPLR